MQKAINALKQNNINVIECKEKSEISKIVEGLLFDGAKILAGGSVSVKEAGVWELINKPCYNFLDRNKEGLTPEQRQAVFKEVIGCDFYFCSANAITENGEILNIDGFSNRISAVAFGPKRVILVVGKNKIVKDLNEAFLRVKKIAAPKNCVRLGIDNPCANLGHCVSLLNNDNPTFADGCKNSTRICVNCVVNGFQRDKERFTVILCDEDMGY